MMNGIVHVKYITGKEDSIICSEDADAPFEYMEDLEMFRIPRADSSEYMMIPRESVLAIYALGRE